MRHLEFSAEMHCRSCEQRIVRAMRALDGVNSVETDLKRERVAVEFDDEVVGESELRAAVAGAATHEDIGG